MQRHFLRVSILLWSVLATASSRGGTYGVASRGFAGFRAAIEASVGSLSDPTQEGPAFEARLRAGNAELDLLAPRLGAMYRHFASGKHPFGGRRARLDPTLRETAEGPAVHLAVGVAIPSSSDPMMPGIIQVFVDLYVRDGVTFGQGLKLGADFAAAQFFGGDLASLPHDAAPDIAHAEMWLRSWVGRAPGYELYALLRGLQPSQAMVRELARHASAVPLPAPFGPNDDGTSGLALAKALAAFIDQKPYGPEAFALLPKLPANDSASILQTMVLLLSDDLWPSGFAAVRAYVAAHPTADGELERWLSSFE